ncbi:MAG: cell division protein FtsZ [Bacteroidaceae bacterium]|nr:cell division protein FtsZ [Bacteroidaceae bacterium]
MANNMNFNQGGISFNFESKTQQSIIKVIGVGGGGGNAVNHMYREGIHDVTYVLCNTDKKALSDSPIPNHLQLGKDGLGAGNRPEKAKQAALESLDEIKEMLNDGTRMVFITAGMGGGTGTGAAPIIAQCAKDAGILTVGIVTIPFKFEGNKKINQALDGVEEISKHVDALLVINNERLREIYPELTVLTAFAKADDTLSIAAKSIAEIITMHGIMNLDFQDVTTVLKDGGVAIMSTGYGEGENRVTKAINEALNSPLLNNNDIFNSKKVLLNINFCSDKEDESLMMEEINEVHDFMSKFREDVETKWGLATDSSLGNKVKITLLATGFGLQNVPGITEMSEQQSREKAAIEQEEKQKEGERMEMYYGSDKSSPRRRRYVHIFRDEELDNDDIISMVETIPTYRRTKDDLNKFSSTKPTAAPAKPASEIEPDGILTFNF